MVEAWMLRGKCASNDPTVYLLCKDLWSHFAGPQGFGLAFSCIFFGCVVVLAGLYFSTRPRKAEHGLLWYAALVTLLLSIASAGIDLQTLFKYYVVLSSVHEWDAGIVPFVPEAHLSLALGMICTGISQYYFGQRAYKFVSRYEERSGHSGLWANILGGSCLVLLILANLAGLALMIFSSYIDYGKVARTDPAEAFMYNGGMPADRVLNAQKGLYGLWVVGSAMCDFIYTAVLCTRLWVDGRKTTFAKTGATISRILSYALTTSFITTICAIVSMSLYYGYSDGTVHLFFMLILPKLYTICFFFTLLARKSLSKTLNDSKGNGITFNLSSMGSTNASSGAGRQPFLNGLSNSFDKGMDHFSSANSLEKSDYN